MATLMFCDADGYEITDGVRPESECDESVIIACNLVRGRWPRHEIVSVSLMARDPDTGIRECAGETVIRHGMSKAAIRRAIASLEGASDGE